MRKNLIFVCIIILFTCYSCQKNIEEVAPTQTTNLPQKIKLEEGMLVFTDSIELKTIVQCLFKNNIYINSTFEQKPNGFTSMRDIYNYSNTINDEKQYIDYCKSHQSVFCRVGNDSSFFYELKIPYILSLLANENGMLKVGDMYTMYSNDYIYRSLNLSSLMSVLHSNYNSIPSDVSKQQTLSNIGVGGDKAEYSYKTAYFDDKHRIVARLYKYYSGIEYYYEGFTTAQKKGFFGIWTQEDISMVKFARGTGYAIDSPNHIIPVDILPLSVTKNNDSEVGYIAAILYYGYADVVLSYLSTTHTGTRSGTTVSVTTNNIFF